MSDDNGITYLGLVMPLNKSEVTDSMNDGFFVYTLELSTKTLSALSPNIQSTDTFGTSKKCPSLSEIQQGPTLGLRFAELSAFGESSALNIRVEASSCFTFSVYDLRYSTRVNT